MTKKTLQDLQNTACTIGGLIDGLYVLHDNGDKESANAIIPIIQQAQKLISELNSDLDSVNRDKLQLPNAPAPTIDANKERSALQLKQLNAADSLNADQEGLVRALQVLMWDLCQENIEQGTHLSVLRSGLIAIGNAMESRFKDHDETFKDERLKTFHDSLSQMTPVQQDAFVEAIHGFATDMPNDLVKRTLLSKLKLPQDLAA